MHVLSDEYGYVGPMQIGHVNQPLRIHLHESGDLSLQKGRDLIEYGYAVYIQQYAIQLEQINQELIEKEFEEQYKLDPRVNQKVRDEYLTHISEYFHQ